VREVRSGERCLSGGDVTAPSDQAGQQSEPAPADLAAQVCLTTRHEPIGGIPKDRERRFGQPLQHRRRQASRLGQGTRHLLVDLDRHQGTRDGLIGQARGPAAIRPQPPDVAAEEAQGLGVQAGLGQAREGGVSARVGLLEIARGLGIRCHPDKGPDRCARVQGGVQPGG